MKPVTLHLLQHLKPGGIENFVLTFQCAAQLFFDEQAPDIYCICL